MSLIYTLISKGQDKILADFTTYTGNFELISKTLMKNTKVNYRASFSYENS
jgi:hypothetical protein